MVRFQFEYQSTILIWKILTLEKIAVIIQKFEQYGFVVEQCVQKMQKYGMGWSESILFAQDCYWAIAGDRTDML